MTRLAALTLAALVGLGFSSSPATAHRKPPAPDWCKVRDDHRGTPPWCHWVR